ncbi:MAG: ABC transporter substrate-binding protein/permease [Apilactobacillus sp.]|nr:ABC transporter substrate-binding protein/permease [Apilactobacillus sp.]MCT6822732.1 ABC transporter substrate-binding protein/permease [Apilactobacillus sp.]MCT6858230.1 ABC transporter substrate-binding protein/permease [Apilactobacillus sp.]
MKNIMKHSVIVTILVMMATLFMTAFSSPSVNASAADNSVQQIKKKGYIVMGTAPDYPPYEFIGKDNGTSHVYGADIELGKQISKDLGVKLKVKSMGFDSLLVALQTKKVDMVIAGMNKTPERAKSVDFSNSYYSSGTSLIISNSEVGKIKSYKDLAHKTIGAQVGSVQYDEIKQAVKTANIKGMENINDLILALKSGKVSAIPMDTAVAQAYASHNTGLKIIDAKMKGVNSDNNVAFAKGATGLVNIANKTIKNVTSHNLYIKKFVPAAAKHLTNNKDSSSASSMWQYKGFFISGIEYTMIISVVSVFFGIILGVIFALMRLSHNWLLHAIAVCYIEFIRGTPQLVQIMFIYFGLGTVVNVPALTSGIIAISINSGAYVAEIIRGGINSISDGQSEAALSLGLSKHQSMKYIVLPQAFKNIWPALGNELVTLIKDSSLASVIGVGELMYQMRAVQADTYQGVAPIAVIMVIYFVITFTISRIMKHLEGKISHGTND